MNRPLLQLLDFGLLLTTFFVGYQLLGLLKRADLRVGERRFVILELRILRLHHLLLLLCCKHSRLGKLLLLLGYFLDQLRLRLNLLLGLLGKCSDLRIILNCAEIVVYFEVKLFHLVVCNGLQVQDISRSCHRLGLPNHLLHRLLSFGNRSRCLSDLGLSWELKWLDLLRRKEICFHFKFLVDLLNRSFFWLTWATSFSLLHHHVKVIGGLNLI